MMKPTKWFIFHIVLNSLFFFLESLVGDLLEYLKPELVRSDDWLAIRQMIADIVYGIFWVGIQINHLVYKRNERFIMYILFGILAITVSLAI